MADHDTNAMPMTRDSDEQAYNRLPSPAPSILSGRKAWKRDFDVCRQSWGTVSGIRGYEGLKACVRRERLTEFCAESRLRTRRGG